MTYNLWDCVRHSLTYWTDGGGVEEMSDETTQVWTFHPSAFQLDDPGTVLDPTRGTYWSQDYPPGYRKALSRLQEMLDTKSFLWCCMSWERYPRTSESIDLVEWELHVSPSEIVAFHDVQTWEDIIHKRSEDWDSLLVAEVGDPDQVTTLVKFPLLPGVI